MKMKHANVLNALGKLSQSVTKALRLFISRYRLAEKPRSFFFPEKILFKAIFTPRLALSVRAKYWGDSLIYNSNVYL